MDSVAARLAETVLFPTPPLPLSTIMMCFILSRLSWSLNPSSLIIGFAESDTFSSRYDLQVIGFVVAGRNLFNAESVFLKHAFGRSSGGSFEYTVEGLPESLAGAFIPEGIQGSSRFYNRVLKMDLVSDDGETAVVGRKGSIWYSGRARSSAWIRDPWGDNPYDLHRRFIDEGVVFVRDPLRGPIGVYTSFRDEDGNVLHAVDRRAMGQRVDPPGTETDH